MNKKDIKDVMMYENELRSFFSVIFHIFLSLLSLFYFSLLFYSISSSFCFWHISFVCLLSFFSSFTLSVSDFFCLFDFFSLFLITFSIFQFHFSRSLLFSLLYFFLHFIFAFLFFHLFSYSCRSTLYPQLCFLVY